MSHQDSNTKRHRRYTIARPASAMALLSDPLLSENDDEDHQFDRISDILSNLLQEANEAVGNKSTANSNSNSSSSSIPMVRKLSSSSSSERQYHQRKRPNRIPVRPVSYPSNLRRSKTPLSNSMNSGKLIQSSSTTRKYSSPACEQRQGSMLLESFKRLDSSLAVIDSLSRDLVPAEFTKSENHDPKNNRKRNNSQALTNNNNKKKSISFDTRLSALLLLPLLHVPHALISLAFDCISSTENNEIPSNDSNSLGGMFLWAFIFAITNLMVDKAVILTPPSLFSTMTTKTDMETNLFLPGSFFQPASDDRKQIRSKRNSHAKVLSYNATRPQQYYLLQGSAAMRMHDRPCGSIHPLDTNILARRNSL
jgi:hypothetical protein